MTELERRVQPVVERLVQAGWIEPEQQPTTITDLTTHEGERAFRIVWQEDGKQQEEAIPQKTVALLQGVGLVIWSPFPRFADNERLIPNEYRLILAPDAVIE